MSSPNVGIILTISLSLVPGAFGCSLFLGDDVGADQVNAGDDTLCESGPCPIQVITHSIGSRASDDFADPAEWIAARSGDLLTRVVLSVEATGNLVPGEIVTGSSSGCSGTVVGAGNSTELRLTLNDPIGVCDAGETLTGESSNASVRVLSYLSQGVIEKGEVHVGVYPSTEAIRFTSDSTTTDEDHYMWLTAVETDRHFGVPGDGVVLDGNPLVSGQFFVVLVDLPFTRIEWIEIIGWQGARRGIDVQSSDAFLQHLLLRDSGTGVAVKASGEASLWLANSLIFNVGFVAVQADGDLATARVANTTVFGCLQTESDPTNQGCVGPKDGGRVEVVNSIVAADRPTAAGDFFVKNSGTFGSSDDNASSDTTAPGPGSLQSIVLADVFTSHTVSPPVLTLQQGSALEGVAGDPGWPFDIATDLSGSSRSGDWNIGAF